jgi:hypothetical protein
MRISIRTELAFAALLAAALVVFAFAANADAKGKYKTAEFKATIKGTQKYTDKYDHESQDRCDPSVHALTQETIRFASKKPVRITFTKIPGVKGLVVTSGDKPLRIPTTAKVTRSHETSYSAPPGSEDECGANGGGVPEGPEQLPDCGTKTVTPFWMTVDFYKRGHLELQPEDQAGSDLFERCGSGMYPEILTGVSFGKRQDAELDDKEIFNPDYGQLITIGKGNEFLAVPDGYQETKLNWDINLKRIK